MNCYRFSKKASKVLSEDSIYVPLWAIMGKSFLSFDEPLQIPVWKRKTRSSLPSYPQKYRASPHFEGHVSLEMLVLISLEATVSKWSNNEKVEMKIEVVYIYISLLLKMGKVFPCRIDGKESHRRNYVTSPWNINFFLRFWGEMCIIFVLTNADIL